MFDYRAHYESQPSVSVDFLRAVQFLPETFTVLGRLSVTISEIVTVAGCTLVYGKRANVDNISD